MPLPNQSKQGQSETSTVALSFRTGLLLRWFPVTRYLTRFFFIGLGPGLASVRVRSALYFSFASQTAEPRGRPRVSLCAVGDCVSRFQLACRFGRLSSGSMPLRLGILATPQLLALLAEALVAQRLVLASPHLSINQLAILLGRCRKRMTKLFQLSCLSPRIVDTIASDCLWASATLADPHPVAGNRSAARLEPAECRAGLFLTVVQVKDTVS